MRLALVATTVSLLAVCAGPQSPARAGFLIEAGDAGGLPGSAQVAIGAGPLDRILGSLLSGQDVDTFAIVLDGGRTFSASTVGLTAVDTKLFLFDSAGRGVYANDDADVFSVQSTLPAGDPLTPLAAGLYYLAVAGFDLDPVSAGGRVFPDPFFPEGVFGPTGPGGGLPVAGYEGDGSSGSYIVALTGARFASADVTVVPPPPSALVLALGSVALVSPRAWPQRRRR